MKNKNKVPYYYNKTEFGFHWIMKMPVCAMRNGLQMIRDILK